MQIWMILIWISLIKLIFMKALASVPNILSQVDDIRKYQIVDNGFEEYRQKVRLFIENVTKEVSDLIGSYEQTIAQLRSENQRLKISSPSKQFIRTKLSVFSSPQDSMQTALRRNQQIENYLSNMNPVKSRVFASGRDRSLEELRLSPILKISYDNSQMNPEGLPLQRQGSRFELKDKRKRHREQQLRHFLECGKKSMNLTTQKCIEAFGKKEKNQVQQQMAVGAHNYQQNQHDKDSQSVMNKSLTNICNSLDTSFVSKKARNDKRKRQHQIQKETQLKKKKEAATDEMLKKRGITSLLQRLRENVDASPKEKVQTISASRYFSNPKEEPPMMPSPSSLKKSSRVMINPVPIDIQKKSKATKKQRGSDSPVLKPHSILKQSTVLTRSISGISAIQFDI